MLADIGDRSAGSGAREGADEPGPAGPLADYAQRFAQLWQTS
jgi:hypothetical protein